MENIWVITTALLLIVVVAMGIYIRIYRKNIIELILRLEDILGTDTNQILTVYSMEKDVAKLITKLNFLIKDSRMSVIKMRRLNKNFRESITSISHDLRTPLTTADGYVQMLMSEELSDEERRKYLEIIKERQDTVKKLLDQLFEYARIEAGDIAFEMEPIDTRKLLEETIAIYYEDFSKMGQEPTITLPDKKCIVLGDKDGVTRIFSNIIYNSLVHGKHSYRITYNYENRGHEFTFANSSEEMNKEELENIFERFYTTDKSRNKKTTGLGLSIAKQIVEKVKGKIRAEYEDGILSIIVWLPDGAR